MDKLEEVVKFADFLSGKKDTTPVSVLDSVLTDLREATADLVASLDPEDDASILLEPAKAAERNLADKIARAHKVAIHALDAELALKHREADQRLRPCSRCQSEHFLIRDHLDIETRGPDLELKMIVCSQCGDVRFECPSPAMLRDWIEETFFRRVNIASDKSGPFR